MSNEIVRVPFYGDEIECVVDDAGKRWVVVKRVCESLGIDRNGQQQRLRDENRSPWAVTCMMHLTAADGKNYRTFCVDLDTLPMMLATVDVSRVDAGARPKLITYQREAAKVLRDYAFEGGAINPRAALSQLEKLRETIDLCVSKDPSKYRVLWERAVIRAIGGVYRLVVGNSGPPPVWFGNIAGRLYEKACSFVVANALRERALSCADERGGYVHWHRMFTPEARLYMNAEIGFIRTIAEQSRTKGEFWARVDHRYEGKPFQHGFGF